MKQCKRLFVTLFAAFCVSGLACAVDAAKENPAKKESAGEYATDSWITTKVKASLLEDNLVKATEVNVETMKGVVQLNGFVSSDAAMNQAVKVTRSIKGVTSVKNNMRIK